LNVNDLGFQAEELKQDPEERGLLQKRAHKLQLHQKLGIATLVLVGAAALTAKEGEQAPENHEILGMVAGATYFTTAYFSLTAPEPKVMRPPGWNMKLHKAMAFIHFPAMLLLPFAGKQASDAYRDGKEPDGLGKHKKTLANAAVASLAVSAIAVSFDF
jgi:hypothetical protein